MNYICGGRDFGATLWRSKDPSPAPPLQKHFNEDIVLFFGVSLEISHSASLPCEIAFVSDNKTALGFYIQTKSAPIFKLDQDPNERRCHNDGIGRQLLFLYDFRFFSAYRLRIVGGITALAHNYSEKNKDQADTEYGAKHDDQINRIGKEFFN